MAKTKKKKILIVDDEEDIVNLLKIRLASKGFEVVAALNGKEALDKTKSERPDLLVLDVMMPPPNGFQVCHNLKNDPEFRNMPIILLTAKTTESDKFWGMESGADAYIPKPYNAEDLLEKINTLLKKND